jgi:hypothetical protein
MAGDQFDRSRAAFLADYETAVRPLDEFLKYSASSADLYATIVIRNLVQPY